MAATAEPSTFIAVVVAPNPVNLTVVPRAPDVGVRRKKFPEEVIVSKIVTGLVPSVTVTE